MRVGLIPAAGTGSRLGGALPKQYQPLAGVPLICHAIEAFASAAVIDRTYVILARDDETFDTVPLSEAARARTRALRVGGATRQDSVLNGLEAIAETLSAEDWVLVHDAARPGLSCAMILEMVQILEHDPVGGLLALPLADTLKAEALEEGLVRVARTVERAGLWQAQTPQMFRYEMLRRALALARSQGAGLTDEASAIELAGFSPRLVPGSLFNFKVTFQEDLLFAERLITHD